MPSFFSEGNAPLVSDTRWRALEKILGATLAGGGSGGSAGVTTGSGAPPTNGSVTTLFYKDTATSVVYINTGTVAVPTWDPI